MVLHVEPLPLGAAARTLLGWLLAAGHGPARGPALGSFEKYYFRGVLRILR